MTQAALSSTAFYNPELYELRIGPGPRVAEVYLPLAHEEGGPILELGCGTGDVLLPIARENIDCVGLDNSPAMLSHFRKRINDEPEMVRARLKLVECDMATFSLPDHFRQLYFTNDGIAHLLSNDQLIAAFSCALSHLYPGGRLVLDVTHVDVAYLANATNPWLKSYRQRGEGRISENQLVKVWELTDYCDETHQLTAHFRYEFIDSNGAVGQVIDRTLYLRPRHPDEILLALKCVGFESIKCEHVSRAAGDKAWLVTARAPSQVS